MINQDITWNWYEFEKLSAGLLYQILKLRAEVFVVEQNCSYQDLDGKDQVALHLCGCKENNGTSALIASARLFLPNEHNAILSFGRVLVSPQYRGLGYGELLISQIVNFLNASPYQDQPIVISAQYYLIRFYQKFGFEVQGEPYNEDGIKHIEMIRQI